MKKYLFTLFVLIACYHPSNKMFAQKDTSFWFVAPEISQGANNYDRPAVFRFSTYSNSAVITISQPANPAFPPQTMFVPANASSSLSFPPYFDFLENLPPNTVLDKGFYISSSVPISVYYEVIGQYQSNPEIFSLKGQNALGTSFYIPFQNIIDNSSAYSPLPYSAFDIVATENNTTINIIPSKSIVGHSAYVPFSIILNKGQTYSARSLSQSSGLHPTGSLVTSNKPIAITVKDDLLESGVYYGGFCRDLIGDQLIPFDKVGTKYVVQKGQLSGEEVAFVIPTTNGTIIKLDGNIIGTLDAGQTTSIYITSGSHYIETSAPSYVWQVTGNGCEVGGEIIPPLNCSGSSELRFVRTNDEPFILFLVTEAGSQNSFYLNGNNGYIPSSFFQVVPGSNGAYVAATVVLPSSIVPVNVSSIISNSSGLFQMGLLNGTPSGTGCRFAYFSDFGNKKLIQEQVTLCSGESIYIHGMSIDSSGIFSISTNHAEGCDTIFEVTSELLPSPTTLTTLSLCPGESINIGGILYNQPGTVTDTIPSLNGGCDTIATYIILRADQPVIYDTLSLCPGDTLMLNGHLYWQTGTFLDTIYAPEPGVCDTLIYYTLEPSPIDLYVQVQEVHCENGGVAISGNICNQGTNALPEVISLGLYSSNPFTSQPETQSIHLISTNGVDSCYKFLINNLNPTFLNYSSIYVIVNDDGAIIPPFSSMNFPQGNIIECNYLNNLDSIDINAPNQQIPNLGPDLVFCQDTSIVLNTNDTFFQYLWQDGSTNATFHVEQTGNYWVQATDICGLIHSDTVQVAFDLSPDTSFADQSICPGVSVHLGVPNGYSTFLWAPSAGIDCPVCQNVNIQPATTTAYTLNAFTSLGCILSDTFTINVLTLPTRTETISFCPGESILIDGQTYNQSATVIDTIPSVGTGCDTIVTYLLTLLPQPTYTQIIEFCKGDQVSLNNQIYSEPGIVTFAIPSSTGGCDTLATYILQYLLPDSPVQISIACPDNISIEAAPGQSSVNITFDEASATSDCPCPGIKLWQSSGPANSSDFPIGTTPVCFTAADSCNNTNTCCFNVSIQAAPEACDIKTIGCVKFELLGISLDGEWNRRYTIRLTNNCNNKLIYTAFQIPDGLPALYPSDNSIFTAPSGRTYLVRNPNYTPSYSIRFKSVSDSISNGEYEVFNYQIPAQIAPDYIHAMVRLEPQIYYEVHLNTFYCPITHEGQIQRPVFNKSGEISLFPNPTDGLLWIDLSSLNSPTADLRIFDTRGNLVLQQQADVEKGLQSIALPEKLPNGVYFVQVQNDKGENQTLRFVVQR